MWEHVRTAENTNKQVHRGTSKLVAEDWQNNAGPHWQTSEIWTSKHLRALFFSSFLICSIRFCYWYISFLFTVIKFSPYTSIYCLALTTVCQYYPSGIRHDHGLQDGNPFPAREFKRPGPILSNHEVACKLNCRKNTAQMSELPAKDKCCVDFWYFCLEKCLILHISPPSFSQTKWPLLQPHAPVGMASRQLRQQQAPTEVQHHGILSEDTCEIFWKHKQNHEQLWTVPSRMPSRMLYANGTKTSERCHPLPFVQAHSTPPQHVTACHSMSQKKTVLNDPKSFVSFILSDSLVKECERHKWLVWCGQILMVYPRMCHLQHAK